MNNEIIGTDSIPDVQSDITVLLHESDLIDLAIGQISKSSWARRKSISRDSAVVGQYKIDLDGTTGICPIGSVIVKFKVNEYE